MKTFNIYKTRAGQSANQIGTIQHVDFDSAKKEFAKNCYNDLLNGKHGDNYSYNSEELNAQTFGEDDDMSWFKGNGIYYCGELFLSDEEVEEGFAMFSHDVYTWELRDTIEIAITDKSDGEVTTDFVESMEQAERIYPFDEYTVVAK